MKKIETHPRINRNNDTVFNGINRGSFYINTVTTDVVMSQNWLRDTETSAMDIIELNSSNSTETSPKDTSEHSPRAWSYINTNALQNRKNDYWVNEKARQARRTTNENQEQYVVKPDSKYKNQLIFDDTNSSINNSHKNNFTSNHPINCFTIIQRHFVNSDTSSDDENCSNVELTKQMGDVKIVDHDKNKENGDVYTYDLDLQEKKRMIWIYSFKNKHLLDENDCSLMNTSFDTDSSVCSLEKVSEETNVHQSIGPYRISSPVPPIYVPRLDLSAGQTLSTVTELSDEGNKHLSPSETGRPIKRVLKQKPINNWFANYNEVGNKPVIGTKEVPVNIVNWLALSPRQEVRKYNINSYIKSESDPDNIFKSIGNESKFINNQKNNKNITNFAAKPQETGIKFCGNNKMEDKNSIPPLTPNHKKESIYKGQIIDSIEILNEITPAEPDITDNNTDKVNHNLTLRIPKIRINKTRPKHASKVTSPIEKLDSNNWILEDKGIKLSSIFEHQLEPSGDVVIGNVNNVKTNDRLWSKNAKLLMKPAQWEEYQSISETPISLSLSGDSGLEKKTLLSRLIKCFRCFKWYK